VARRHDINANQLFKWRRELARSTPTARLVPVAVTSEPAAGPVLEPAPGRIEIVLSGGVRVRIEGAADPAVVTAAMAAVMKARRRR
jgi:transposase